MIGLEYILQIHGKKYNELASDLGVKKQNVSIWISKKAIPKKYLSVLSEMFDVPEEIFEDELDDGDKLEIDKLKIANQTIGDIKDIVFQLEEHQKGNQKLMKSHELGMKIMEYSIQLNNPKFNAVIAETFNPNETIGLFADIISCKQLDSEMFNRVLKAVLQYYTNKESSEKILSDDLFTKFIMLAINKEEERKQRDAQEWGELFDKI